MPMLLSVTQYFAFVLFHVEYIFINVWRHLTKESVYMMQQLVVLASPYCACHAKKQNKKTLSNPGLT